MKKMIFVLFLLKTLIVDTRKNCFIEAVLASTQNLYFRTNKENNAYPCKPHFYCIKEGLKGVNITLAC